MSTVLFRKWIWSDFGRNEHYLFLSCGGNKAQKKITYSLSATFAKFPCVTATAAKRKLGAELKKDI